MPVLVHHLLLSHDLSEQIWVLDIVWQRVHHGIVVDMIVNVEIIATTADYLGPCHYSRLFSLVRTGSLKIFLVLTHLHHLAISLHLGHLMRSKRYFLILFLMLDFLFSFMSILQYLLI